MSMGMRMGKAVGTRQFRMAITWITWWADICIILTMGIVIITGPLTFYKLSILKFRCMGRWFGRKRTLL